MPEAVAATWMPTPVGSIRLEFSGVQLVSLRFACEGNVDPLPAAPADVSEEAEKRLRHYFETGSSDLLDAIPIRLEGTPFQIRVWEDCRRIPAGATATYGEIARRLERPGAARAVGTALGRNPIPIVVPCHRVVRADGGLGGFRPGLSLKRTLLELETREKNSCDITDSLFCSA